MSDGVLYIMQHIYRSRCLIIFIFDKANCSRSDNDEIEMKILASPTDYEYLFISGFETIKVCTEDKISDFISLMGNYMIPTTIAEKKYT